MNRSKLVDGLGPALAGASTLFLLYVAIVQLLSPAYVVAVQAFDYTLTGAVILVIVVGFLLGMYASKRWEIKSVAETVLASLAVFAASGLIGLLRVPDTDRGSKAGLALILVYALVHLAISIRHKRTQTPRSTKSRIPAGKRAKQFGDSPTEEARTRIEQLSRTQEIKSSLTGTELPASPSKINENNGDRHLKARSRRLTIALVVLLFAAATAHLVLNGYVLYAGPRGLTSHTFDHGIFVQSMEGILRTGQPVTTLERARPLSHFAVHFSPVLYLVVPFYAVFRSQEFLNLFQLVPVFLAMLPLYKVLRLRGFSLNATLLTLLLYIVGPAQIFSSHYGFHENVFLGLGIFSLWYFWEARKPIGIVLGAALVLAAKEDAFIYVLAFALWQLFDAFQKDNRGRVRRSIGLGVAALAYFAVVSAAMARLGEGTMQDHRFANLIPEGADGFSAILNVMLTQPGYVLTQVFLEPKWSYILTVMAAVAFAPLWNRSFQANWLLVPLVMVNLLSNWKYQYDIGFQYHYGSSALLLIILVVAISPLMVGRRPVRGGSQASTELLAANRGREATSEPGVQSVGAVVGNDEHAAASVDTATSATRAGSTDTAASKHHVASNDATASIDIAACNGATSGSGTQKQGASTVLARRIAALILAIGIASAGLYSFPNLIDDAKQEKNMLEHQIENADEMRAVVKALPKDKTYLVSNHLGPAMAAFPNVYLENRELPEIIERGDFDFIVIDNRFSRADWKEELTSDLVQRFQLQEVPVGAPLLIFKNPARDAGAETQ